MPSCAACELDLTALAPYLQDFRRGQQLIVERDFAQLCQFFQASAQGPLRTRRCSSTAVRGAAAQLPRWPLDTPAPQRLQL